MRSAICSETCLRRRLGVRHAAGDIRVRAAAARPSARTPIITARHDVIANSPAKTDRAEQAGGSVASSAACTYSRKNL